jgi:hypothetical protein
MEKFQATDISIFDNHEQSTEVLRGFLLAHSQHLHEMKINKDELILIVEKYLPYIENYKENYQVALLQYLDGIIGSKDNLVVPFLTIRYYTVMLLLLLMMMMMKMMMRNTVVMKLIMTTIMFIFISIF